MEWWIDGVVERERIEEEQEEEDEKLGSFGHEKARKPAEGDGLPAGTPALPVGVR